MKTILVFIWDQIPAVIKWPALLLGAPFIGTVLLMWTLYLFPMITANTKAEISSAENRINDTIAFNQKIRNGEIANINDSLLDIKESVRKTERQNNIILKHVLK